MFAFVFDGIKGVFMQLIKLELNSLLGRVQTRHDSNVRKPLVLLGDWMWIMSAL